MLDPVGAPCRGTSVKTVSRPRSEVGLVLLPGDTFTSFTSHIHPPKELIQTQRNIFWEKNDFPQPRSGKDDNTNLTPPTKMTLEEAVEYVIDDEFVEVTPDAIRMGVHPKRDRFGNMVHK